MKRKRCLAVLLLLSILLSMFPLPMASAEIMDERETTQESSRNEHETEDAYDGTSVTYDGIRYEIQNDGLYHNGVKAENGNITWVTLHGDTLFWSQVDNDQTDIYRKDLLSGDKVVFYHLFVPVESFDVSGNDLYYLFHGEIVKVNMQTHHESVVLVDRACHGFRLDKGSNLHAIKKEGYYSNSDLEGNKLKSIDDITLKGEYSNEAGDISADLLSSSFSFSDVDCSLCDDFIHYSRNKDYVKFMLSYYYDIEDDIKETLHQGKPVIFFFEGASDQCMIEGYNWSLQRVGAVCIILKYDFEKQTPYISYWNDGCSTLPDYLLGYGKYAGHGYGNEYGTATAVDGIYNIITVNHNGRYAGFQLRSRYDSAKYAIESVYMKDDGNYSLLSAAGINIHTRTSDILRESSPFSAGCILVGNSSNLDSYNSFIKDMNNDSTDGLLYGGYYSGRGTYKRVSTGIFAGKVVVDRHLARNGLLGIYNNAEAVETITGFSTQRAMKIDIYECGKYICKFDDPLPPITVYVKPHSWAEKVVEGVGKFIKKIWDWFKFTSPYFPAPLPPSPRLLAASDHEEQYVYVLGSVSNAEGKWYLLANNTYVKAEEFDEYFEKAEDSPSIASTISINPTSYPAGSIPKKSFSLAGTITSTCDIKTITGTIYDVTADKISVTHPVSVGTTRYSILGSALDRSLKFQYLTPGHTYYLEYKAVDITGNSEIWRSGTFSVYNSAPNVSITPGISTGTTTNGQRISVSCSDSAATIHYTVNGGQEQTGTSSLGQDFTTAGSYNIDAWTTRDGYSESSHNYKTISVMQAEMPTISDVVFTSENAYVTISGSGSIYYTTDGTAPNRGSPQYNGPIYLRNSCTLQAISVEEGKQDSNAASKQISVSVPDSPSASLLNTKEKIAVGKTATVSWQAVPMATAYDAILYYHNEYESALRDLSGTTASFALMKDGAYTIRVQAKNFLGSSAESVGVSVEAMPPVTVTVVDRIIRENGVTDSVLAEMQSRINAHDGESAEHLEGNILSVQTIDYDSMASRISAPDKKGFKFEGFSEGWSTSFISDTTVYAEYSVLYYDVEFWNYYGEGTTINHRIGEVQRIMYTASAVAPESGFDIPVGYKLAGWSVDNTVSHCFDYTYVDENMRLYTSYTWANENLPAIVQIDKVKRDDKCTSYTVNLRYINNNLHDTQARVIISLYSAANRMVYTQTQDLDLDRFVIGATLNESIQLNYVHKISKVSAVLVQVKNDLTGGAVSETASTTEIEFPNTSGYWTGWSDWDTTSVSGSDTRQVEQTTQYQYRDKEYTTSDRRNLDGWEWYNRTEYVDGWSDWSANYVEGFENESTKRVVESRYIEPTYRTDYHYYRFYSWRNAPWTHYSSSHPYFEEYWKEGGECPYLRTSGGMKQYGDGYTGNAGVQYWLICDGSTYGGEDALRRGFISDASWTRQVQTGGGYWEYRYQDTHYTHYFWRWRGWSGWEDNAYSGTSEREVQTRTIYRYRDYRLNYPGYDPNRDSSLEEQTVATYDISGNILGLTEDYSGKRATVLVYKKTNTDPTQEQLEYVDQIILGSNNSYSFTVNVKEKPSY